jgi:hypothetical protein
MTAQQDHTADCYAPADVCVRLGDDYMTYSEDEKKLAEESKLAHDYFKHLTTLSTGSILLIATFLDKLFAQPEWKFFVGIAIVAFLISIICSIIIQAIILETMYDRPTVGMLKILGMLAIIGSWSGFLIGVMSLGIFALKNLC